MTEHPNDDEPNDDFDDERAALGSEPLRVEGVDRETGERVEGVIYRDHLARAQAKRGEQD